MNPVEIFSKLDQALATEGYRTTLISAERLQDVKSEMQRLLEQDVFDRTFHREKLSHYSFRLPSSLPEAKSLIITAARQPKYEVSFRLGGRTYPAIIPPAYYYDTDDAASGIISSLLRDHGYRVAGATVPAKALAAHAGLVSYGKNNITYIEGWGSYFRLRAFFSDLPCLTDAWGEPQLLDPCEKCDACIKGCPSKAITTDRFVFYGERCLCYLNESEAPFPDWIEPSWHNSLIGCMRCQDACPENKDHTDWVAPGVEFSEDETAMIILAAPIRKLSMETVEKLKSIYLFDDYAVLGRNLRLLIENLDREALTRDSG